MSTQLDILLNQLKYTNRNQTMIDVDKLIKATPTLQPKIGELYNNDGSESRLLVLAGTIPIFFQNNRYNIPVDLYVDEKHPNVGPRMYVRPNSNMIVKQQHRNVDVEGLVYLPYLSSWSTSSSLSELVNIASNVFSAETPLFARQSPIQTQRPVPVINSSSNLNQSIHSTIPNRVGSTAVVTSTTRTFPVVQKNIINNTNASQSSGYNSNSGYNYEPTPNPVVQQNATSYNNSSYTNLNPPSSSSTLNTSTYSHTNPLPKPPKPVSSRDNLIKEVTDKLRTEIDAYVVHLKGEIDKEEIEKVQLVQSYKSTCDILENLKKSEISMNNEIEKISIKSVELDSWLSREESKGEIDIESRITSYDVVSEQLIRLNAEQLAIEDCLYMLEKRLTDSDEYDLPAYLKETRRLAKQQFLSKMWSKKIIDSINNN